MASHTAFLNLIKPKSTDAVNINDFDDNFDIIDTFAQSANPKSLELHGTPTTPDITSDSPGAQIANKNYVDEKTGDAVIVVTGDLATMNKQFLVNAPQVSASYSGNMHATPNFHPVQLDKSSKIIKFSNS
jgi:hypothetical protein